MGMGLQMTRIITLGFLISCGIYHLVVIASKISCLRCYDTNSCLLDGRTRLLASSKVLGRFCSEWTK